MACENSENVDMLVKETAVSDKQVGLDFFKAFNGGGKLVHWKVILIALCNLFRPWHCVPCLMFSETGWYENLFNVDFLLGSDD